MIMKEYKKEDVTILWDAEKCTHSGVCARGLSAVFKPKERPWIQTENANKDEIVQQVLKCPSGALSIKQ
ncbi:MAG: (4Fe-4S)-binding protein [Crocinitomicaceae bacterium]|nr:(4Fe-4S)-binding protein [Crocinitomicaceae bacterium]